MSAQGHYLAVPAPAQRITIWTGRRVHPLSTAYCGCGRRVHALALDTTGRCDACAPGVEVSA